VKLILIGLPLVLAGVVLPFLMVLKTLEPTFWLSFVSAAASIAGLALGVAGVASIVRVRAQDHLR
jgi:hypothetical protein